MKKKNNNNELGFEVPQGYFESTMDRLFDKVDLAQERNKSPFSVPSGYFENLEERVMNSVQSNESIDIAAKQPFDVPQSYFENLENRVLQSVSNEMEHQADNKETPFTTPENYFEDLEQRVLKSTVDKPVVKLNSDMPSWVVPMLAVAAIFVAVMAINGFWNSNALTMEDVDSEELALYLAETDFTTDQDAMDILYSNTNLLDNTTFETSIDNEVLLDYLADEVDMNQMIQE